MSVESGAVNLEKIDTIVVVWLENCSFDQMLGYLSLEQGRRDIDGLRAEFSRRGSLQPGRKSAYKYELAPRQSGRYDDAAVVSSAAGGERTPARWHNRLPHHGRPQ